MEKVYKVLWIYLSVLITLKSINLTHAGCITDREEICSGKTTCNDGDKKAHPTDCERYQECIHSTWTTRDCPGGMEFDYKTCLFVHIHSADCFGDSHTCHFTTEQETSVTPTTREETASTAEKIPSETPTSPTTVEKTSTTQDLKTSPDSSSTDHSISTSPLPTLKPPIPEDCCKGLRLIYLLLGIVAFCSIWVAVAVTILICKSRSKQQVEKSESQTSEIPVKEWDQNFEDQRLSSRRGHTSEIPIEEWNRNFEDQRHSPKRGQTSEIRKEEWNGHFGDRRHFPRRGYVDSQWEMRNELCY